MEFTIPKTPPRKFQKVKPFPLMESSNSIETEDLNDGEGEEVEEEEMNSFDDEKENNNDETETSIQIEHQTSINTKSLTPQPSARASDNIDLNEDNSPSVKEKINKLYSYVPEIASHFTIIKRIGEGTFSSVYLAKLKHHPEIDQMFALKHIIPTSHPVRIENELKCLLDIGGCDNVMGVKMCVRNRDHVVIVMSYFPHTKFQDCLFQMTFEEGREYMKNLLLALQRVHQFDVIHRDVKPANFLYNRETKQYALVDFGLASGPFLVDPSKMSSHKHSNQATQSTTTKTPSITTSSFSASLKPTATATPTSLTHHASLASPTLVKAKGNSSIRGYSTATHTISPLAVTATTTPTTTRRSPSRQPLSPLKRGDGSGRRNLMGRVTKINEKREAPLLSASSRLFAPNFSSASASLLRQSSGLCDCYGKPVICELCVARNMQLAPRAGTAGFRAPEVLLKSPNQDTAVDIWSAGVIFLSMMSARYPFFKATDDLGYMAQIISLLGTQPCMKAALSFGKLLTLSEMIEPCDLQVMCEKLRHTQIAAGAATSGQCQQPLQAPPTTSSSLSSSTPSSTISASNAPETDLDEITGSILDSWADVPVDAYHLLGRLLDPNPRTRITAKEALSHPFFNDNCNVARSSASTTESTSKTPITPHTQSCSDTTTKLVSAKQQRFSNTSSSNIASTTIVSTHSTPKVSTKV